MGHDTTTDRHFGHECYLVQVLARNEECSNLLLVLTFAKRDLARGSSVKAAVTGGGLANPHMLYIDLVAQLRLLRNKYYSKKRQKVC